ncbi:hypothetical protein [Saccharopolyspora sp. 5N708]|uniref:hypothetical protein n=1 Tax=Saccharopolyspora sp. 5N708 TaxID=3457424 RepID=UPI003FD13581
MGNGGSRLRAGSVAAGSVGVRSVGVGSVACLLVAGSFFPPAAQANPDRTEQPVRSSSPISQVQESVVRVKVPLPAAAGEHPEACDWLSYLRFRHVDGPASSARADRIHAADQRCAPLEPGAEIAPRRTLTFRGS